MPASQRRRKGKRRSHVGHDAADCTRGETYRRRCRAWDVLGGLRRRRLTGGMSFLSLGFYLLRSVDMAKILVWGRGGWGAVNRLCTNSNKPLLGNPFFFSRGLAEPTLTTDAKRCTAVR